MLLQQWGQQNACTHLSKLFCCRAHFVPLFLSSGEWQAIFKQTLYSCNEGESKCNFSKNTSQTPSGQCSCHNVLNMYRLCGCDRLGAAAVKTQQDQLLPLSGTSFSTPCSMSSCRVRRVDIFLSSSVINTREKKICV